MQRSAGLLFFRRATRGIEVLSVHPGDPYWRNKGVGASQSAKRHIEPGENAEKPVAVAG